MTLTFQGFLLSFVVCFWTLSTKKTNSLNYLHNKTESLKKQKKNMLNSRIHWLFGFFFPYMPVTPNPEGRYGKATSPLNEPSPDAPLILGDSFHTDPHVNCTIIEKMASRPWDCPYILGYKDPLLNLPVGIRTPSSPSGIWRMAWMSRVCLGLDDVTSKQDGSQMYPPGMDSLAQTL